MFRTRRKLISLKQHLSRENPQQLLAQIASVTAILVGCLVLLGWSFDIAFLKSVIPQAATMKANTAVGFILAGISLGLQTRNRQTILITRLAQGCAIAVSAIGLLTLCQYLFNWNLGIDELLFQDNAISPDTVYPGRMGDNTALNFSLTGLALYLNGQRTRRSYYVAQSAIFISAAIALLAVVGYVYNVEVFYRFIFYSSSMAIHTALTFLVLCIGILALQKKHGWIQIVTSNFLGAVVARQLIPAAIALPLLLGWLIRQGQLAGWYDPNFGLSLMVISLIVILLGLIGRSAAIINKIDGDRKRSSDRLRSSEERLQLALAGANQGTWDWDLKTETLTWDDRCKEIFGLPPDFPVTYEWHLNALHPDDRERVFEAAVIALRDHIEFHEEYRTFHPDGTMHWILARGRGYYDGTSEPERMTGTVMDISDRKQAESAFIRTNGILQTVINGTRDVIYVKDLQGRYVLANQAAAIWLNKTVESMLGQDDLALFPDDVARRIQITDQQVIENEEFITYEEQLLKGDELRSLLSAKYPWRNELGEVVGLIGISIDVTDLKQAEADLKESNEYIQILYEISRDLLSTYQPLSLVDVLFDKLKPLIGLDIYFNYLLDKEKQKLHLMFHGGISEEMAREIEWLEIGQAICGTVAQQRCQIVQPNLQQSTDPKTELVRSLGLTAYSCQPLISQGKLFGTLGFGSFTRTEFTPAETKLFQVICDRIAIALERSELISSLQQQTEELTSANRLKDEFLAALSHELRTPLNPILGWTKLLQVQNLTTVKSKEALLTIERNVKQQIALVDDLLDISRVVQGKFQLSSQPADLVAILKMADDSVRFTAIAKSITLEFHYPADSITRVMGDETRLQQVFWNLLSNAIKFTPDGGNVDIWLEKVQNTAQISITDTGIGIAPEFLPYVFDRFRQADGSTTRRYGGLGLGLALAKHLVELHGGTIEAESSGESKGATFKVKLPLLAELLPESTSFNLPATSNLQTSSIDSSSLAGIRALVVDDEPDNLDLIDFILKQEGAIVTTVTSGTEALEIVSKNPPDILISDIGMPEMDGYELLQQIRALSSQQDKPVKAIALSAFAQQEDQEKAIAVGFQVYLSKPVNLTDLVTAIAAQVCPS
ncbi:MAG: hypothetical protein RLZZ04_3029 [Cyanobacteriota bacterium]|jgi:PAS domain S-box-containing protein